MINEWWLTEPEQRFWMETIRRPDFGDGIRAPYTKQNLAAWPYYELVGHVRDGDVVLHWDSARKGSSAFVGYSTVDGLPYETSDVAYSDGTPTTGLEAMLRDFTALEEPLTLNVLHGRYRAIEAVRDELADRVPGSFYFPFDARADGTIRGRQGAYLTKFPVELFEVLPELNGARASLPLRRNGIGAVERGADAAGARVDRRQAREAGYIADPKVRRAIEMRAVELATAHYVESHEVKDVGSSRPYDLLLTHRLDGTERRVEVKGSTGVAEVVELTVGEVRNAREFQPTDLVVVAGIEWRRDGESVVASGGTMTVFEEWRPDDRDIKPTRFRYSVPAAADHSPLFDAVRISAFE